MTAYLVTDDLSFIADDDGRLIVVDDATKTVIATAAGGAAPAAAAYAEQLLTYLPPGIAWSAAPGSVMARLLAALAVEPARIDQRSTDLLDEADPRTTYQMLADWETTAGLPDTCVGTTGTVIERRRALVARLTGRGGQSIAYLIGLAAALGYTITIEEHHPWRVGQSSVAEPLQGAGWAYRITVHAPQTTITSEWTVGQSAVTDPLRSWGNVQLECAIRRAAPAHVVVRFAYDMETA